MGGTLSAVEMNLSIALSNDRWLNVGTRFERPPLQWPFYSMLTFILTAAIILITVFWFLISRFTGPLRRLVGAVDRLGRGEEIAELPAMGPSEVREITSTFNKMQDRLTRFVAERTRLLASLGHDLRSPLTAIRVRAELVDDEETRNSLVASVEEMQTMVEETLTFARGMSASEASQSVEFGYLLRDFEKQLAGLIPTGKGTADKCSYPSDRHTPSAPQRDRKCGPVRQKSARGILGPRRTPLDQSGR